MKKPVVKGVNLKNPPLLINQPMKKGHLWCVLWWNTHRKTFQKNKNNTIPYSTSLERGGGLWDVPVIGHELLRNQSWQWKMTRVCPCVWPMFSFFDRFSNTIFDYLHIPFSKRWTTKPYVCATMLNLSVYFKLWTTYQLSYLHLSTQVFTSDLLPLPDYSFGG
jgi:hypothetical protein